MKFIKFGGGRSARLSEIEDLIGCELPSDYRAFLVEFNGGEVDSGYFNLPPNGLERLSFLYGVNIEDESYDLLSCYRCFSGRTPKFLLPFGCDPFGNQLCIKTKGGGLGSIWFWDHEGASKGIQSSVAVSKSFTEFISSLDPALKPFISDVDSIVESGALHKIKGLIESGVDIDKLYDNQRTLLEKSTIKNKLEIVRYLHESGASIGNSLMYAEQNAEFFPEHLKMVELLKVLYNKE